MTQTAFREVGAQRYHFALLSAVDEFGPCSQAELCRRLNMDRKDVAVRTAELEELGLLRRHSDSEDVRRNAVRITEAGRRRLDEIASRVAQVQEELLSALEDSERRTLLELLDKVRASLNP
jgi:DNA-binding MarR family transcriptional regulator